MKKKSYIGWMTKEDYLADWREWKGVVDFPDELKTNKDDLKALGLELVKVKATFEIIGKEEQNVEQDNKK